MDNEQLVESIKNLCKEHNITVTKLEETLGMSQGLIGRWNKSDPSISKIINIADYFGVSLDEVVGYKKNNDYQLVEKLIEQTMINKINWKLCDINGNPKHFFNPNLYRPEQGFDEKYLLEIVTELSYYTCINNGYISIYAAYEYDRISNPFDIKLFIQPDDKAELLEQNCSESSLTSLWYVILDNIGIEQDIPDSLKADKIKKIFINANNEKPSIHLDDIKILLKNPHFEEFMNTINTPEFKKMQQTLSNPEFQKAIQIANKVQQKFNTIQSSFHQKED